MVAKIILENMLKNEINFLFFFLAMGRDLKKKQKWQRLKCDKI
jgi:hypothetical protein